MMRRLKYTLGSAALEYVTRFTPLLDSPAGPPDLVNFAGAGDYTVLGDRNIRLAVADAGLSQGDHVLDIGCAIGRNALALHRRFGEAVAYDGFDIVRFGITWCRKWARRHAPDFRFHHADLANGFYNPRGRVNPLDYRFPRPDSSIDVSIATSVYTHMTPDEVAHYLRETARVTRPGGRLYATAFLDDEGSRAARADGAAMLSFDHAIEGARIEDPAEPTLAVLLAPSLFADGLAEAGARQVRFLPGSWRGAPADDLQDRVIAEF